MFRLSRKPCLWIAISHTLIVVPSFLKPDGGEIGPAWVWTVLIYDTPLFFLLVLLPSLAWGIEVGVHRWVSAPAVFLFGPIYWMMLVVIIPEVVDRLNRSGIEDIDRRIRERQARENNW